MSTVPGLDVSYWQAEVDWQRVQTAGPRFVFIKATEGVAYTDSTFVDNWEGAGASGLLRGAYCFFHPNQDPLQQADRFVSTIKERDDDGELPGSIDLEVTDGVSNKRLVSGVKTWLDEVEQRLGRRAMIYSGISFLETYLVEREEVPAWTRDHALWLGWFPNKYVPGMSPMMPRGWPTWTFWQYSGKGRVNGINAQVDLDLFNGTPEQLAALAKTHARKTVPITHLVAAGETADSIANKYLISVGELMAANPQLLKVGDKLTIPGQVSVSTTPLRTHTIQAGETLYSIAKKYGTTIAALVARNKISNPDLIQVGQVIVLA